MWPWLLLSLCSGPSVVSPSAHTQGRCATEVPPTSGRLTAQRCAAGLLAARRFWAPPPSCSDGGRTERERRRVWSWGDGADVALGLVPCWRTLPCASLAVLVGESPLQCCVRRLSPLQRSVTLTASAERWRGKNQKPARPRFFPLSSAFSTGNTRRLRCLAQLLRRFPAQDFPPCPSVSAERGSVTAQRSPLAFPHRAAPERAAV